MPASALAACAAPGAGHAGCTSREHPTARSRSIRMRSRVEDYYRRGLEAQQHAAQEPEQRLKKAFEQAADNWFTLAEQAIWLEQYSRPRYGRPTPKEPE